MRRYIALTLAVIVLLSASCGRQTTPAETTNAEMSLSAANDADIALPETTQEAAETSLSTEAETTTTLSPTTQPPATTTQPPATTTQPPATTMQPPGSTSFYIDESELNRPPERGSAPFTPKFIRGYFSYTQYAGPTADVVESRKELDDLLCAPEKRSDPSFLERSDITNYTDEWFASHRLIVIGLRESSGSNRHNVRSVNYTNDGATVKLKRLRPDVCTCDIAYWLIYIELPDTRLHSGDPVELIWE